MRYLRILLMAMSLIIVPVLAKAENVSAASFNTTAENTITRYIRPAFDELTDRTYSLQNTLEHYCETKNADDFSDVFQAFADVTLGFARIDLLRFGPLIKENRLERLYFWPDRKGLAIKRIRRELLDQDPAVLKSENLKTKSVAIQGLGGLEYLMFGKGVEKLAEQPFRCAFAASIAGNIHIVAKEILDDWNDPKDYSSLLLAPGQNNAAYRSSNEVGNEIFKTIINGLEAIKRLKLGAIIGKDAAHTRPKRAQLWRSELTLRMLVANLSAIEDFTNQSGLLALLPPKQDWVVASIAFEFKNATTRLEDINVPIDEAVVDPEPRTKLLYAMTVMDNLQTLYSEEVAPHLGLRQGFNTLDGD